MVQHIALNILREKDIVPFYQELLGCKETGRFVLDAALSKMLFNYDGAPLVVVMSTEGLVLELFITGVKPVLQCAHICLSVEAPEQLVCRAQALGYQTYRSTRAAKPDLLFVRDTSGNMFELKSCSSASAGAGQKE